MTKISCLYLSLPTMVETENHWLQNLSCTPNIIVLLKISSSLGYMNEKCSSGSILNSPIVTILLLGATFSGAYYGSSSLWMCGVRGSLSCESAGTLKRFQHH
ncbi:hypothetical protein V6N13_137188 [Hibiscus sabdariffa]